MGATTAELTRPETNADRDFLPQDWCGTCALDREAPVSSAGQQREPGWALAAVRAAVREGRLDFPVQRPRADLASPETLAAVREHQARPTRYEKQLDIPPLTAHSHQRGKPWRQFEMCRAQWADLQQIRANDRARRARKRWVNKVWISCSTARSCSAAGDDSSVDRMDVTVVVTWQGGLVTHHTIRGPLASR
jgi:hypothetical protein